MQADVLWEAAAVVAQGSGDVPDDQRAAAAAVLRTLAVVAERDHPAARVAVGAPARPAWPAGLRGVVDRATLHDGRPGRLGNVLAELAPESDGWARVTLRHASGTVRVALWSGPKVVWVSYSRDVRDGDTVALDLAALFPTALGGSARTARQAVTVSDPDDVWGVRRLTREWADRTNGAEAAARDDLARDVARAWGPVEADWMQGDPFPRDLSDALDRLAAAYGSAAREHLTGQVRGTFTGSVGESYVEHGDDGALCPIKGLHRPGDCTHPAGG